MTPAALTKGDAFLLIVVVALPIAAIAFMLVGPALRNLGKGRFAVQFEDDLGQPLIDSSGADTAEAREDEIRQMVEAKAFRQAARGEQPLNVEAEVERLLDDRPAPALSSDPGLVEEVRQLVVARNERRARRGEEPLDVEAEIERQLRELENLGQ